MPSPVRFERNDIGERVTETLLEDLQQVQVAGEAQCRVCAVANKSRAERRCAICAGGCTRTGGIGELVQHWREDEFSELVKNYQ